MLSSAAVRLVSVAAALAACCYAPLGVQGAGEVVEGGGSRFTRSAAGASCGPCGSLTRTAGGGSASSWGVNFLGAYELDSTGADCSGAGGSCVNHVVGRAGFWTWSGGSPAAEGVSPAPPATGTESWIGGTTMGTSGSGTCTAPGAVGDICPQVWFNATVAPTAQSLSTPIGSLPVDAGGVLLTVGVSDWLLVGGGSPTAAGVRFEVQLTLNGAVFLDGVEADTEATDASRQAWTLSVDSLPLRASLFTNGLRNGDIAAVTLSQPLPTAAGERGRRFTIDLPLTAQGDAVEAYVLLEQLPIDTAPSGSAPTNDDEGSEPQFTDSVLFYVLIGGIGLLLCILLIVACACCG